MGAAKLLRSGNEVVCQQAQSAAEACQAVVSKSTAGAIECFTASQAWHIARAFAKDSGHEAGPCAEPHHVKLHADLLGHAGMWQHKTCIGHLHLQYILLSTGQHEPCK